MEDITWMFTGEDPYDEEEKREERDERLYGECVYPESFCNLNEQYCREAGRT